MSRERVIVTGGRDFGNTTVEHEFISRTLYRELRVPTAWAFDRLLVVVGDCPTGVDASVYAAVKVWGLHGRQYRAKWATLGKRAGPERNGRMIADGAIRVLAFPGGPGTSDCIRQAQTAAIPVVMLPFSP